RPAPGRRGLAPGPASDLGRLDAEAIARVRAEAWPEAANADELHDALVWLGFLSDDEAAADSRWPEWLADLAQQKRAAQLVAPGSTLWITAQRLPEVRALWPEAQLRPQIPAPQNQAQRARAPEEALTAILRGRVGGPG